MSSEPLQKTAITLDDLLQTSKRVEIINWEMYEMAAAGGKHHLIVSNIDFLLQSYVREHKIGSVFPDGMTYLMFSESVGLKDSFVPDVSFIKNENIPADWDIEKPHPGAPDLAVEVISRSEKAEDIQYKIRTYLDKGTQEVWIVYSNTQEIHQYHREPESIRIYRGSHEVESGLLPGIDGLTVSAIFDLPFWAQ
jgi:Uma2 family endonuclease